MTPSAGAASPAGAASGPAMGNGSENDAIISTSQSPVSPSTNTAQAPTSSSPSTQAQHPHNEQSPTHHPTLTRGVSFPSVLSTARRQNRIDEILDTARKRSIALGDPNQLTPDPPTEASAPPSSSTSFQTPKGMGSVSPRGRTSASSQNPLLSSGQSDTGSQLYQDYSSADEATGILRKARDGAGAQGADYQGVRERAKGAGGSTHSGAVSGRSSIRTARDQDRGRDAGGDGAEGNGEEEDREKPGWLKRYIDTLKAVELDNKGSVARDHLALERTFLAWLRTSLAFASIGVAVTQLFRLNTTINTSSSSSVISLQSTVSAVVDDGTTRLRQLGKPLGATFIGISILTLFIGFHRYFESQHWIMKGKFPASRGSVALVSLVAFALMVTSLVVVIAVDPGQFERR